MAAVTGFIAAHGGWVVEAAQHGDLNTGRFFQRIEVLADSLPFGVEEFAQRFSGLAEELELDWHLHDTDRRRRVVVLVSKEDHCLIDLLHRWRNGDLDCDIPRSCPTIPISATWWSGTASNSGTSPSTPAGGPTPSPKWPGSSTVPGAR